MEERASRSGEGLKKSWTIRVGLSYLRSPRSLSNLILLLSPNSRDDVHLDCRVQGYPTSSLYYAWSPPLTSLQGRLVYFKPRQRCQFWPRATPVTQLPTWKPSHSILFRPRELSSFLYLYLDMRPREKDGSRPSEMKEVCRNNSNTKDKYQTPESCQLYHHGEGR